MEPIGIEHTESIDDTDAQSLRGVWERAARKASPRTLVVCAAAGVIGLVVIPFIGGRWLMLTTPLFAVGGFGGWGLLDREYERRISNGVVPPRMLLTLRRACMAVGAAGLAALGLTVMIVVLLPLIRGGWR